MADHPELILTGGPVLTMDTSAPEAEAIAVSDGLIQAVGTAERVLALRGPRTETVDLAGQSVLPGFIEAHGHPTTMALALAPPALDVRPFMEPTGQGVLRRIREAVAAAEGEPVAAYGIDLLLQRDLPPLERHVLDEMSPHAPLVVLTNSGHAAYANTAALRAARVTRDTPDPAGARYVRDADGEPTGVAHETAAVEPLARVAIGDRLRPDRLAAALDWAYAEHARVGITTATDMATLPDLVDALRQAAERPGVPLRVRSYLIGTAALAKEGDQRFAGHAPATELFGVSGIKFWAEGTAWEGSIATSFPYQDNEATRRIGLDPCSHGSMNYTPGELADLVRMFAERGFPVACHVHGDVTVDAVLDAYEQAAQDDPQRLRRLRPRLEHCGAVTPAQFRRAAQLGATVSLFMDHIRWWGDVLADDLFSSEIADNWMAARSAQDAGHRLSLHNDGACSPTDPLSSIATALTRRTLRSGRVHGTRERLTIDEALRAVTVNPAWQLHLENEIGMVRPGMRADLAVLSRDPRTADPDRFLDQVAVTATYFGGRPTWTA
ncbi:amidohydrolase [Streptomyces sp. NPDC058534]|uniref:amidohydrolase n=1 Tax=Streptomyces sp. NPDC058534 TaxID=3346541 RepID=UPI00365C3FB9